MTTSSIPDGVTPRTPSVDSSSPDSSEKPQQSSELPTATATAPSYSPLYATAQPGSQPSVAAPTASAIYTPTETSTATSMAASTTSTSPPPPQPGARPEPTAPVDSSSIPASTVPPPPKAGEVPTPQQQVQRPPPTTTQLPQPGSYSYGGYGYSSTAAPPQLQQPYQQQVPNSTTAPYASVCSAPSPGQLPLHYNTGNASSAGMDTTEEEGFYGSAKSWLQTAGNKLAEVEAEVWRRINNHHDN